ncbi:unnamed protein product, partial [Didymodactylos carnosus]
TSVEIVKKKVNSQDQLIEVKATFELPRINLLIEESLTNLSNDTQPFVRMSIFSIVARATIKTYDIDFDISVADLIVIHEQFITKTNDRLRLIAVEHHRDRVNDPFISIHGLLTSSVNPLLASTPYNGIENQVKVHIGKPVLLLQLEPLLSIVRFKNDLMDKISKEQQRISNKRMGNKRVPSKKPTPKYIVKKDPLSVMPTFQIDADLDGLRAIIGSEFAQILDIHIQDLHVHAFNSIEKTLVNLIVKDFYAVDPSPTARHRKIISQQGDDKQLLRVDFSLFNYSNKHEKTLDEVDCDVKVQLTKVSMVLLYKHVDLILSMINVFQTKKPQQDVPSNQTSTVSDTIEKFQRQARKLRLDVTINAPSIFAPTSSYSSEGLFLDLGQLTIQTHFIDDPNRLLVEQQIITINNLFGRRVKLNKNNEILGDIGVLECAELHTLIERLLYPEKIQNEPEITIQLNWDTIQFILAKDDYACIMKIFKDNFTEKIHHKIPKPDVQEQPKYKETNQEQVIVTNNRQDKSNDNKVLEKICFDALIKKIALTLYLGESNINTQQVSRNENLKFVDLRFEMLKAHFQQLSDSSYNANAQIQELVLDDLRETNQSDSITRMINRNFNVDPNIPIFNVNVEFKPKKEERSMGIRQVNGQLESFYICISADYLMALQDFFVSSLSSVDEIKPRPSLIYSETLSDIDRDLPLPATLMLAYHRSSETDNETSESTSSSPQRASNASSASQQSSSAETDSDLETIVDIVIKTPEIILLEDQHNTNSSCLVLGLASQIRMVIVGDNTKMSGSLKNLTICGSTFAELKNSKNKYPILGPLDIDAVLIMNLEEQKIDVRIGDITVQIPPATIHTIRSVTNSLGKLQSTVQNETEKINDKSIFNPKPFKDASLWFIEDNEEKQEMLEQKDILEEITGAPSHKKAAIEEANKQKEKDKKIHMKKILTQELIINLKVIEVKLELGSGSSTKPIIAMCFSDLLVEVKNWSTNINIFSKIYVELALFNDNLLAWQPLIEPVIDEKGEVVCPWCITCSTSNDEDEEEENDKEVNNSMKILHFD